MPSTGPLLLLLVLASQSFKICWAPMYLLSLPPCAPSPLFSWWSSPRRQRVKALPRLRPNSPNSTVLKARRKLRLIADKNEEILQNLHYQSNSSDQSAKSLRSNLKTIAIRLLKSVNKPYQDVSLQVQLSTHLFARHIRSLVTGLTTWNLIAACNYLSGVIYRGCTKSWKKLAIYQKWPNVTEGNSN